MQKVKELAKSIDKDALIEYYKTHSLSDTAEKFGIEHASTCRKLIASLGFRKNRKDVCETAVLTGASQSGSREAFYKMRQNAIKKAYTQKHEEWVKTLKDKVSQKELDEYYKDHSLNDTSSHFSLPQSSNY